MIKVDPYELYQKIKHQKTVYDEEVHCPMMLRVMMDPNKCTVSSFCIEAGISDDMMYRWINKHPVFMQCYAVGKMYAREMWEEEGRNLKDMILMPGQTTYAFEHWRMLGWTRFGISKNSRIRLQLNPDDKPNEHYSQLLRQAANGDFTAGEIKQLMEAINVGLNAHQVIAMQKMIDQLNADFATMKENSTHGNYSGTTQGAAKEDKNTVEN